jgi:hypothetical protein
LTAQNTRKATLSIVAIGAIDTLQGSSALEPGECCYVISPPPIFEKALSKPPQKPLKPQGRR